MTEGKGFSVEVQLIRVGGNLLNLDVCMVQIQKEKKTFTLTGRSDVRTYHIKQFISEPLEEPPYSNSVAMVPICFDRNNPDNKKDIQLKLMVKPENHTMIQYFITVFNQLIEENRDPMKNVKTSLKRKMESKTARPVVKAESKHRVRSESRLKQLDQKTVDDKYMNRKLENTGNSCFLNSVMQALAVCQPFYAVVSNGSEIFGNQYNPMSPENNNPEIVVFRALIRIVTILRDHRLRPPSVTILMRFREAFGSVEESFRNKAQQDAHEYFLFAMAIIDRTVLDIVEKGAGTQLCRLQSPASTFKMAIEVSFTCQGCGDLTRKTETRSDISLMIHKDTSVESLLPEFVKWSALEKHCSKCKHTVASTCERIVVFPPCLVIKLERHERVASGRYQKKTCAVRMSHKIDASKLGIVDDLETHPGLDVTNRPEEKKNEVADDGEVKFVCEKVGSGFDFHWLRDSKQLTEMLRKMKIRFDESTLQKHCSNTAAYPMTDFKWNDLPGERKSIVGDGNCLFRALSWCLSGDQRHYNSIREAIKNFMEDNREMMEPWCDDYDKAVKKVSQNHEWGSHTELIAFSTCFNINVYTYLPDGWKEFKPLEHACFTPTFTSRRGALYLDNSTEHYEPVLCLEKQLPESKSTRRTLRQQKNDASDEEKHSDNEEGDVVPSKRMKTSTERPRPTESRKLTSEEKNILTAASKYKKNPGPVGYTLASVVCHTGNSTENGHYVAYTKNPDDGSWLYCSDMKVEQVEEHVVTEQAARSAYLLFYVKNT